MTKHVGYSRYIVLGVSAALVVLLLLLASMVTNGTTSRSVAANARSLHWVNSVLGSAGLARAANAQAVVFAVDHELGVASLPAFEAATNEANIALDYLVDTIADKPDEASGIDPALDIALLGFVTTGQQVVSDIEGGDTAAAMRLSEGNFEDSFRGLSDLLSEEQTRILQAIDATESAIGKAASIANIAVTLLIPGLAITFYFLYTRRQLREKRKSIELQLEAALELSRSKDEFIGSLSHELRTPLTSIYGFSEFLLNTGVLDPKQATELITIINSESGELMRMVEDLLTGARLDAQALTFETGSVSVLKEIEAVVNPLCRSGLQVSITGPSAVVVADQMRFRQVLRNLVSNAQKHGGPQIAIGTRIKGDQLVVAVIDNGPGVPEEIEGRMFERFVHDSRRAVLAGSVGLGLAIARDLTVGMGGSIQYERVEGHTVFSVMFPLVPLNDDQSVSAGMAEEQ